MRSASNLMSEYENRSFFCKKLICGGGRVISNREMPIGEGEMFSFQLHRVVSRVQEEGRLVVYRKESTCVQAFSP
jgi:hypothetical protein